MARSVQRDVIFYLVYKFHVFKVFIGQIVYDNYDKSLFFLQFSIY